MTAKIFRSIMLAVSGVLIASLLIILGCLYSYFDGLQKNQLWAELDLASAGVESSGIDYFSALNENNNRLTWIAPDGSVRFDAQANENTMENHSDREEVKQALSNGKGSSERYSETKLEKTVYCAERLSDGSVLRISISRATVAMLIFGMMQPICIVILVALILSFFIARRLSKRIVEPLNNLDLDRPLENQTYDEIVPLLGRISRQSNQINLQLKELKRKKDEFNQITAGMREGLVLLDNKRIILSINHAAKKFFDMNLEAGNDFLIAQRNHELSENISRAINDGHSELSLEQNGRNYQLDISRIESDNNINGVVLLILDVTEKINAERTRREFTANVSHELRTPLTAILGSSEMISNAMVKSEDIPRFIGHIHDEAARLLNLIEDIIRLSQLDEGVKLPMNRVYLDEIVNDVAKQLSEKAESYKISLTVNTQSCPITGITRLFYEIAYNLIDNAIKYNLPGGSVTVKVTRNGDLIVSDTGIGIAAEHQSRVFERFYRVDKSHSKAIGGTGLGLSIVKHAAAYLHAEIELDSKIGEGTTVSVHFVKEDN